MERCKKKKKKKKNDDGYHHRRKKGNKRVQRKWETPMFALFAHSFFSSVLLISYSVVAPHPKASDFFYHYIRLNIIAPSTIFVKVMCCFIEPKKKEKKEHQNKNGKNQKDEPHTKKKETFSFCRQKKRCHVYVASDTKHVTSRASINISHLCHHNEKKKKVHTRQLFSIFHVVAKQKTNKKKKRNMMRPSSLETQRRRVAAVGGHPNINTTDKTRFRLSHKRGSSVRPSSAQSPSTTKVALPAAKNSGAVCSSSLPSTPTLVVDNGDDFPTVMAAGVGSGAKYATEKRRRFLMAANGLSNKKQRHQQRPTASGSGSSSTAVVAASPPLRSPAATEDVMLISACRKNVKTRVNAASQNRPASTAGTRARPSASTTPTSLLPPHRLGVRCIHCSAALRNKYTIENEPVTVGATATSCECPLTIVFDLDETLMYNSARKLGGEVATPGPTTTRKRNHGGFRRPATAGSTTSSSSATFYPRPYIKTLMKYLYSARKDVESVVWTHGRRQYAAPFVAEHLVASSTNSSHHDVHPGQSSGMPSSSTPTPTNSSSSLCQSPPSLQDQPPPRPSSSSSVLLSRRRPSSSRNGAEKPRQNVKVISHSIFAELGGDHGTKTLANLGRSCGRVLLVENNVSSVAEEDKQHAIIVPDFIVSSTKNAAASTAEQDATAATAATTGPDHDRTLLKLTALIEEIRSAYLGRQNAKSPQSPHAANNTKDHPRAMTTCGANDDVVAAVLDSSELVMVTPSGWRYLK